MPPTLPHRCSRCFARMALKYHWKTSPKQILCPSCGYDRFYIDKDRLNRGRRENCGCGAYHYPHRKGSGECMYVDNPLGINNPISPDDPRLSEESRKKLLEEIGVEIENDDSPF